MKTKRKKNVHKSRQQTNNHSFINNGLVLIVQNHMACSLLEWLYYNVTCIVWMSNSIAGCCSRVTDSSWHINKSKHRKAGTFCSLHAQERIRKNAQYPCPLNMFTWKAELWNRTSILGPLVRRRCFLGLQKRQTQAFANFAADKELCHCWDKVESCAAACWTGLVWCPKWLFNSRAKLVCNISTQCPIVTTKIFIFLSIYPRI